MLTSTKSASNAGTDAFPSCTKCGKKGHTANDCRSRQCRRCKQLVTNFKAHNKSCKPTIKTSRVETIEVSRMGISRGGETYIPALDCCSALIGEKKIPLLGYADTGARRTLVSTQFVTRSLIPQGARTRKTKKYLIKGVDPSGKGILTDESIDITYLYPNGFSIQLNTVVVEGLPEDILYGLDWQAMTQISINPREKPGECYCESKKAGFKVPFLSEKVYRQRLDAEATRFLSDTAASLQAEKVTSLFVSLNKPEAEELSIFDHRSAPSGVREKDRR
jgi:hypothetical protein